MDFFKALKPPNLHTLYRSTLISIANTNDVYCTKDLMRQTLVLQLYKTLTARTPLP